MPHTHWSWPGSDGTVAGSTFGGVAFFAARTNADWSHSLSMPYSVGNGPIGLVSARQTTSSGGWRELPPSRSNSSCIQLGRPRWLLMSSSLLGVATALSIRWARRSFRHGATKHWYLTASLSLVLSSVASWSSSG